MSIDIFGAGVAGWAKKLASKGLASLEGLGIPNGFGIFADAAKFKTVAVSLNEKLAMQEAMSGRGVGTRTEVIKGMKGDPRVAGFDVSKYSYNRKMLDAKGRVVEKIEIHYLKNNKRGATFDFKFNQ